MTSGETMAALQRDRGFETVRDGFGEVGDLQTVAPVKRALFTRDPTFRVRTGRKVHEGDLPIFVHEKILREIIAYSRTDLDREVGGVMVGGYFVDGRQEFIEIDSYYEARFGDSQSASFRFTPEAWTDIQSRMEKGGNGEKVMVGWHHTHPTFGCFLSGQDMFIQNHFFNLPWMVALVVDPCRDKLAFFQWKDHSVEGCGFYLISPLR